MKERKTPQFTSVLHVLSMSFFVATVSCVLSGCGGGGNQNSVVGVTVTPATASVAAGLTQQFKVTASYSDGTTTELTQGVSWSSNNQAVAKVDASSGLAQTLAAGSTTITATYGSLNGSGVLTVTAPIAQSLTIAPYPLYAGVGITVQLSAMVT